MIKVLSVKHTLFAARHLVTQLNVLGVDAVLVDSVKPLDRSIYIIYNASGVTDLPRWYIVMQTEIASSHWFNKRYYQTLKNAVCIWEYNESNITRYRHAHKKIAIVSPGVSSQLCDEKTIPLLFYGWIEGSRRRESIIKYIETQLDIKVVTNSLESEMWDILRQTKVVLNIHYYDHSPLELFRLNESLSFGCHVVSEGYNERYSMVSFQKTAEALTESARQLMNKEFNYDLRKLDNLTEIKEGLKLI